MAVKDETIVAGQGWVYTAASETEMFDVSKFDPNKPATFTGWDWLGSTSKENLISLEREGGDSTVLDTWDTPGMRSVKSVSKWMVRVQALGISEAMFKHAWPGGTWEAVSRSYEVPDAETTADKAVMVVIKDPARGYLGLYFPKGSVSIGGAPTLATENFMEVPIDITALSGSAGYRMKWVLPEPIDAGSTTTQGETPQPGV